MDEKVYEHCSVTGKRCYSEREANIALSACKRHYHNKCRKTATGKIPKRKYYCKSCNSYHLTSQSTSKLCSYTRRKKKYIKVLYTRDDYDLIK